MKRMLINAADPEEARIAVVEDGVLQELHVEVANREAYLGNIYKGRVVNIEPSIGAAFVAFGGRSNGFLHASDILPAYTRPDFRLEDVVEGRAKLGADDGPDSIRAALADTDDDDEDDDGGGGQAAGDSGGGRSRRSRRRRREDESEESEASVGAAVAEDGDPDVESEDGENEDGENEDGENEDGAEESAEASDRDDREEVAEARITRSRRRTRATDADRAVDADEPEASVDYPHAGDVTEEAADRVDAFDDEDDESGEADPIGSGHGADDDDDDGGWAEGLDDEPSGEVAASTEAVSGDAEDTSDDASGDPVEESEGGRRPRRRRRRRGGRSDDTEDGDAETSVSGAGDAGSEAGEDDAETSAGSEAGADGAEDGAAGRRKNRKRGGRTERPRTRVPIEQLVKKGQELIVQVTKEGIGNKGPTLTTYVSLPGRSLVLMPSLPKCGVSRKIDDAKERRRLKRIVKDLDETGNGGVGFIIRTNGIEKSKADLQRDRDYLKRIWELVGQRVSVTRAPALLYQESDLVLKAMRDLFSPEIEEVVVDSKDVYLRIKDFAEKLMPHMADRIKLHELITPLFHSFGIEQEVEKLYQPKIELPNGASIVIDQAEALVAIDVNSGRFKPGTKLEETAYRTNLDAIPEIVRQLRLRDLGGLIMIDFIDMASDRHRRNVERRLVDELKGDRARIKVGRISPFGMLEVTRQRVGPGLKRTVFSICRHCSGSGLVRTVQSKALAVLREVQALLNLKGFSILQVFVSPAVNDYLVNYKRRQILDFEESTGKGIVFKAEVSYPIEAVHYRFMTGDGQEARVAIPAGLGVKA